MSNHVRFVVQIGGSSFAGSTAKKYLKEACGWPVKSMQEAIKAANYLGARLWVFREPRKLSTSKSRYKKFCCLLGIGRAKRKWKLPQVAHHPPAQAHDQAVPVPQWTGIEQLLTPGGLHYVTYDTHFNVAGSTTPAQGGQNGLNQQGPANPVESIDDLFS